MKSTIKRYSELIQIDTFEERFEYLKLKGAVGQETFGFDRYLNQDFYRSRVWRNVRRQVILRDMGCDLGISDQPINGRFIVVHHMNPITVGDICDATEFLLDPEFLITTCELTHKAIHYGDINLLLKPYVERRPGDTCPWK